MKLASVILLTSALLAACSGAEGEEEERDEAAAGDDEPAETAESTGAPEPVAEGAEAAGEPEPPEGDPLEVVVKESQLRSSIPTDDETVLHAEVDEGTLEVHIEHLEAACGPVPDIEARLVGQQVVLQLVPAEDRHCIGRQEIKLRIDLPRRPDLESVQLRGADGGEVVTVDVPS